MTTFINTFDRWAIAIAILALAANAFILTSILLHNPAYLKDYRLNSNPDAVHFVTLARNIYERQVFSRETAPPFAPCGIRQPGYPVVMGAFYECLGTIGIYLLNVLCHVATAVSIYLLCKQSLGVKAARIAGIFVAADLMLANLNFTAMSEPLFCLVSTIGILLWLQQMLQTEKSNFRLIILIGVILGYATMVRPTSLYVPIVMLAASGIAAVAHRSIIPVIRSAVILLVACCCIAPWILRNYRVFNLPVVSTTDATNLIYFCGASVLSIEQGISVKDARENIAEEFGLVSLVESNNHWIADRSLEVLYKEQKAAVNSVIFRYPTSLIKSSIAGCVKASFTHNVGSLAFMCGMQWNGPKLTRVLEGDFGGFFELVRVNPLILSIAFFWQMFLSLVVIGAGLIGIARGLLHPNLRLSVALLCALMSYYYLTVAVVGLDAYSRHRSMIVPIWCIFACMVLTKTSELRPTAENDTMQNIKATGVLPKTDLDGMRV